MDFLKNSKILYTIVALVIALIAVFTNNSPISLIQQHENSSSTSSSTSDTTSSNECSAETQSNLQRLKATGYLPAKSLSYKKEMINTDIATLSRICKNQERTITMVKANSASI